MGRPGSPLQLLHVIPTLDHASGGPAIALLGLAKALERAGAAVSVVVARADPDDPTLLTALRDAGVRVHAQPQVRADASWRSALETETARCDVCHIHALWEPIQHRAAVLCRRRGKPHVFRPCGMLDPWSLGQSRLKKQVYIAWRLRRNLDRCSGMHFATVVERDLVRPLGFKAPSIVEANGVELAEFQTLPPPGAFRSGHPMVGDRPLLLFMGRLRHYKGLDLLIPAFARLAAREAVLALVGPDEGGYRATAEALVAEHGVGDRVLFTGLLKGEDRLAALADADLFVLPSHHENFGVAVVEALAAETPVVVSDQVHLHAAIRDAGVGGVAPTDVAALADEIDVWLADPARRAEAARRSRPFVRDRYEWSNIAERWLARYERLCRGEPPEEPAT